ncbi:hypothetical protein EC9_35250 [Rosistilla ulvae]|uniref:Uncharacterized protein n=1 Tax=Rosistilla ulvae TaxID=1930277 RepID=A0A517M369_9BACT|nr:hypothetical protein EC9_35250 [Rosistilla ulvae]
MLPLSFWASLVMVLTATLENVPLAKRLVTPRAVAWKRHREECQCVIDWTSQPISRMHYSDRSIDAGQRSPRAIA